MATIRYGIEEVDSELIALERLRIFDIYKARTISRQRKEYECKIQQRTKSKEDFLRYIQYEMDLLKIIGARRDKLGIHKKSEAESTIAHRVNKLFKQMIFRFQDDIRLWLSYIKFCKQFHFYGSVSHMLVRMLQIHGSKPDLWKLAAKWEFEESQSIENARQFLLRGLRCHPASTVLYTEAFRLELVYADLKRKQQDEKDTAMAAAAVPEFTVTPDTDTPQCRSPELVGVVMPPAGPSRSDDAVNQQVVEGHLAGVIYETASKKVNDVAFLISLLSIAKGFSFTDKVQAKIVNDLLSRYPDDELTWDAMAHRELEGLPYSPEPSASDMDLEVAEEPVKQRKIFLKEKIRRCCAVYTAAVKQLPTDRMWSLYLDTLIELNQDVGHLPIFKKKLLRTGFQNAHKAGLMKEKYYLHWVDMLLTTGKHKKLGGVLRVATERLISSVQLWQMRLRFHLSKNEEAAGKRVFKSAIKRIGCDDPLTLPLWKIMIQYFQSKSIQKVEQVFRDGIQQGPAVSLPLKPLYIEWLVLVKGIVAARKVYDTLNALPPLCLEMHIKMASFECMQPNQNLKRIRKCFELACDQFGKGNTDVWMEYVKFEQTRGDQKNVSEIYWRALKCLDPEHTDIFISEFSLIKTGLRAVPQMSGDQNLM